MLPNCYAKVGKQSAHISSIYINTPDSSIKASVTDQVEKKPAVGRYYHWYASNQLCVTNGAYSGKLLHGNYSSFYSNHFLQSQGQFSKGLKDGRWKRWLPDGSIHEIIHYKNGLLNGPYDIYSPDGRLQQRIYYRNGVRAGKTIFFSQDGSDSVILYRKGVPVKRNKENSTRGRKNSPDSIKDSSPKMQIDSTAKKDRFRYKTDSTLTKKQSTDTTNVKSRRNKFNQLFRKLKVHEKSEPTEKSSSLRSSFRSPPPSLCRLVRSKNKSEFA
jgi:hypothetical protein